MKDLTLKHLAPYLPYGLKGINLHRSITVDILGLQTDLDVIHNHGKTPIKYIKPILRPLSDLIEEIEMVGFKFTPLLRLSIPIEEMEKEPNFYTVVRNLSNGKAEPKYVPHWIWDKLVKWHFDVFGLIPLGLAIDINTINKSAKD